jgi:hypothetical protein
MHLDPYAHSASIEVAVDAKTAFRFMASGKMQTYWTLGSWDRVDLGEGLFAGTSLWDGSTLYVRPEPHPEVLIVDYWVGADPEAMLKINSARVRGGEELGRRPDVCVITLTSWRSANTTDEAWARGAHVYATEMHLIKGRLEHEIDAVPVKR